LKKNNLLIITIAIFTLAGCVQKSSKKTVIVKLNAAGVKNIQTVGIRGDEKPLSWDYDLELKPVIKDSLYIAAFSLVTGYKFTEAKFTINGQFELNEKGNRKIMFSDKDTAIYEAKFDVEKK
jgi:putative oxidoreductase